MDELELDAMRDLLASAENTYLHHVKQMSDADQRSRAQVILVARQVLDRYQPKCEGCWDQDAGIRPNNDNGYAVPDGWQGIERCDLCERYDDDVDAGIAYCRNHGLKEVRILLDRECGFTTTVPAIES